MSAGEFAFLAIGLLLGVASGAALMEVIRARPPAPREVRLTMATDSVPRRPATLAVSPFVTDADGPARGGPGDRRLADREPDAVAPGSAAGAAGGSAAGAAAGAATVGTSALRPAAISRARVAIPIEPEPDPFMVELRASARPAAVLAGVGAVATASRDEASAGAGPSSGPGAAAVTDSASGSDPGGIDSGSGGGSTGQVRADQRVYDGPCADMRRLVDERCEIAERASVRAAEAADRLRAAHRTYDEHVARAEAAEAAGDPRAVQRAKDEAQAVFRASAAAATTPSDAEAAATAWLAEINRINAAARSAAIQLQRSRAAATSLVMEIERLETEADAARIGAETAAEACLQAREGLARCEEEEVQRRQSAGASTPAETPRESLATGRVLAEVDLPAEAPLILSLAGGERDLGELAHDPAADPAILRILRGDHAALARVADRLAGGDPAGRGAWQLQIDQLVDAVAARAIEESLLNVKEDHPFWSMFTPQQTREIIAALASLGYRFDGLGGFADGRVPSQRDLSLAVGYAGLDPMRIRRWPNEAEMVELFDGTRVAGDEYLLATAPGLTLGELVITLGRRADELAELWNAWGQIRPVLMAPA